jgi:hypothetical protein
MNLRLQMLLCLLGSLSAGAAAIFLHHRANTLDAPQWVVPSRALAVFSLLAMGAALMRGGWYQRFVSGVLMLALVTGIGLSCVEVACRVIGLDFNTILGARRANEAFPIYFRLPTHLSGEVFFTRDPGSSWTGKPLQTLLKNHRSTDVAYADEKEVTIRYSKEGFRNPDDLADWDIAVAGDSFTESGYLPEGDIFTGVAAAKLGKRIKNLGITDSGNFAHAHYIEAYAKAPSCRTAVLAFFEGNDVTDNVQEQNDLRAFQESGESPSRAIPHQPSFLKALWNLVRDFNKLRLSDRSYTNAFFKTTEGEIPVTIADAPPSSTEVTEVQKEALLSALGRYILACQKHGMKPHLLYLPCKRRVLHGHLRQGEDYPQPEWQPGDLPEYLAQECKARGVTFIDSTPALSAASKAGQMTFNTIYDTHFNTTGHRIVGEVLAEALK